MKNKKSIIIIISLFIIGSTLTGAKLLDVELKGADEPLVDLSTIIQCGGSFVPAFDESDTSEEKDEEDDSHDETDESQEQKETNVPIDISNIEKRLTVRISNTKVYVNDASYSRSTYQKALLPRFNTVDVIELIDDYAEYHTYLDVYNYLIENGITPELTAK